MVARAHALGDYKTVLRTLFGTPEYERSGKDLICRTQLVKELARSGDGIGSINSEGKGVGERRNDNMDCRLSLSDLHRR